MERTICDGVADEGLEAATYYLDEDGDGYGDVETAAVGCGGPPDEYAEGYATSPGDCDDTDPAMNPEADEVCDGLDRSGGPQRLRRHR